MYVLALVWYTVCPCTVQNSEPQEETIIRLPTRFHWRNNFFKKGHRGWHSQLTAYWVHGSLSQCHPLPYMGELNPHAPTCMPYDIGQCKYIEATNAWSNYQPSETDERLLRVDPMWWAWSWIGKSGRSAGSGSDGPNTCSWSSNCCANCSSNL